MHGIPIDVIYLDYQKAFDCVPHQRLLSQIESFGISGQILQWIKSFLSNRRQKVRVNNSESTLGPVISGVPHGSILGPVLFSLFVNDLPDTVRSFISMFADATQVGPSTYIRGIRAPTRSRPCYIRTVGTANAVSSF